MLARSGAREFADDEEPEKFSPTFPDKMTEHHGVMGTGTRKQSREKTPGRGEIDGLAK